MKRLVVSYYCWCTFQPVWATSFVHKHGYSSF
jgi:hypothetical protein